MVNNHQLVMYPPRVLFPIPPSSLLLLVRVIDLSGSQSIVDVCLQETGGLGVHCVVDNGGKGITLHVYHTHIHTPLPLPSPSPLSTPSPSIHTPIKASASYFLSDFIIDSASLKQQLEQETLRYTSEDDPSPSLSPTTHQIVSLLAARGHWITSQPELQLDPPESQILYLKGASLHFMFPPVWTLSGSQIGSYLGVLQQVLKNMVDGVIK